MIKGPNALIWSINALLLSKFHVTDGQNMCDQITRVEGRDARNRIAFCKFHSFSVKSKWMLATYMEHMWNNNLKIRIEGSSCCLQLLCSTLQHLTFVKQSGLLNYSLWRSCYKDLQNMYSVLSYHHYHIMFNIYMYLYFSVWGLIGSCFFLNMSSSERGQILEGMAH